jgi:protein-tyrosine phosphatase
LGGSCIYPPEGFDILVGFDYGMAATDHQFPWNGGVEFLYEIKDHHAPEDVDSFKNLINYLEEELKSGKKVHCGCIGGHGRTGLVFSALVKQLTGNKDAISFVRDNYCQKAVESEAQVNFLHKHCGIKQIKHSKS